MLGVNTNSSIDSTSAYIFIFSSCLAGILFGLWNWYSVMSIKISKEENKEDTEAPLMITNENYKLMEEISEKIQEVNLLINFREPKHS